MSVSVHGISNGRLSVYNSPLSSTRTPATRIFLMPKSSEPLYAASSGCAPSSTRTFSTPPSLSALSAQYTSGPHVKHTLPESALIFGEAYTLLTEKSSCSSTTSASENGPATYGYPCSASNAISFPFLRITAVWLHEGMRSASVMFIAAPDGANVYFTLFPYG